MVNRGDRGATLVEYALGIALIAVVCLGAIQFAQGSSKTELTRRGSSIGKPVENSRLGGGTVDPGGGGGGSGTTTVTVTSGPVLVGAAVDNQGNNWSANVTVTLRDSDGNLVAGATVTGDWNPDTTSETTTCTTSSQGTCTVTIANFVQNGANAVPFVTYAVTAVTGSATLNLTYSVDPKPSTKICQPGTTC